MSANILMRLHNMSSSAQFLVAAGLLAVMLAIFSACVWGAASQITARADALISLRTTAGNFMAVVKVGQSFAKQNVQSEASAALSSSVLKGASPSIARADLQERFNAIAASAGVTISSVGNAPDRIRNELKQIGLTVSLVGKMAEVHNTIFSLETVRPYLFIDDLTVRLTGNARSNAQSGEPVISAQFKVYGFFTGAEFETGAVR